MRIGQFKQKLSMVLVLVIVLASSCNKTTNKQRFKKFNQTFQLQSEMVPINEIYKHGFFHVHDSLYILTNTPNDPYQIHLYDKDFRYLSSSGKIGRGPGEINNPYLAQVDNYNNAILFMDMGRRALLKFPIDSILANPEFLPNEQIPLPEEVFMILRYYPIQDGLLSFSNFANDDNLISYFNYEGELVDSLKILKMDEMEGLSIPHQEHFLATFLYAHHPSRDLIVIGYTYSDKVMIINSKGDIIAITQGPDDINQVPNPLEDFQISTYGAICSDENYIYLMYNGKSTINPETLELNYPESIHMYNWSGEPVAELLFDHPINSFTLDHSNKRIISFSLFSGEVVAFNLPDELIGN